MTAACPICGHPNEDWASYCTNCGRPLGATAPGRATHDSARAGERTKTGLLLLVIGFVLAAIPFVNFVAIVVLIVAVVLVFLGADAFGDRHRRFVIGSIVLYVVILVAFVIVLASLLFQLFVGGVPGTPPEPPEPVWQAFVIGVGVTSAAFAVPLLLITYNLQDATGRRILWAALAIEVAVSGVEAWYLLPLSGVLAAAVAGDLTFLGGLTGDPITYLFALSSLPWAFAYYLAYRRAATPPAAPPARQAA